MTVAQPFDPKTTYVDLMPSGAREIPVDESFWPDLISGRLKLEGRLVSAYEMHDFPNWERHPAGEELIVLISGAMDMILEEPAGERTVTLKAGQAFLVPKNIWHRGVVRAPGQALFVTEGAGTESKAIVG
jgi:mannose-6-phosphate isomerase-like protein (cupin superfamily)